MLRLTTTNIITEKLSICPFIYLIHRDINPHIPQYISQAPWYVSLGRPSLSHQRPQEEKQKSFSSIDSWYKKGVVKEKVVKKFRKGACENCGSMTHKKKDCLEVRAGELKHVDSRIYSAVLSIIISLVQVRYFSKLYATEFSLKSSRAALLHSINPTFSLMWLLLILIFLCTMYTSHDMQLYQYVYHPFLRGLVRWVQSSPGKISALTNTFSRSFLSRTTPNEIAGMGTTLTITSPSSKSTERSSWPNSS